MKQVFLITYYFPPTLQAESLQVLRTVRALTRIGWQITVMTIHGGSFIVQADQDLMKLIPPSVNVVRTYNLESIINRSPSLVKKNLTRIALRAGLLEWPLLWCPTALCKAKQLLKSKQYGVIYTRSHPYTSNILGLRLKQETRLPWIAHFSDPWVDNPLRAASSPLWQHTLQRAERKVIYEADSLIFTNQQTVDLVMKKYPDYLQKKVFVIPHGYDSEGLTFADSLSSTQSKYKMRFLYTGAFYGKRNPMKLLYALQILSKTSVKNEIEFIFAGTTNKNYGAIAEELGIGDMVKFCGEISFNESLYMMFNQADVLVIIDAPADTTNVFLPSKLIDYLMTRKPILGLTPTSGASADLLHRLGCRVVVPDNIVAISEAVREMHRIWREGNLQVSKEYESVAQGYSIGKTTSTLHKILLRHVG